jgi:D-glycero-D-manno-heptose 1,7-bisphosphate phosphatase
MIEGHFSKVFMESRLSKAIFLDRDGVIIENRSDYVRSSNDVEFLPGALEALASLTSTPYQIIVVTNQSAVGRGIITIEEANLINDHILDVIRKSGGRIDASYLCPHAPEEQCACRKPQPGMLIAAADELQIDLKNSIMVGDALTDIQAGKKAGILDNYIVLSGRGMDQIELPLTSSIQPFKIISSLADLPRLVEASILERGNG